MKIELKKTAQQAYNSGHGGPTNYEAHNAQGSFNGSPETAGTPEVQKKWKRICLQVL
jgi:hypothetical protein